MARSAEGLQSRAMLSSVTFDSGSNMLDISLDGSDSVSAEVVNDQVEVSINGSPTTPTPNASDVYFINVTGGSGDNLIDLSSLSAADFSYLLTSTSINGGDGNDTIYGSGVMDDIRGEAGADSIDGGSGSDNVWGDDGADVLNGGADSDCVMGGDGDDILWSGSGAPDDGLGLDGECGLDMLDAVMDESDECGGGSGSGGGGPNTPPVAVDDPPAGSHFTFWDGFGLAQAVDILINDYDAEYDSLTAMVETTPVNGKLLDSFGTELLDGDSFDGYFYYEADPGYFGEDQFTYFAFDGIIQSDTPATVKVESKKGIDLVIYNAQGSTTAISEVNEDKNEQGGGAFTVANMNDSDSDGVMDDLDSDGVSNDPDLFKVELLLPDPAVFDPANPVGNLTYHYDLRFWTDANKTSPFGDHNEVGTAPVDFTNGKVTLYGEAVNPSASLRDLQLTIDYAGHSDSALVTAIWVSQQSVKNTDEWSTPKVGKTISGSNFLLTDLLVMPNASGASAAGPMAISNDDWLLFYKELDDDGDFTLSVGADRPPAEVRRASVSSGVVTLSSPLSETYEHFDLIVKGPHAEAARALADVMANHRFRHGADHNRTAFGNGIEFAFSVGPSGIGEESSVQFDITRQKEAVGFYETDDNRTILFRNEQWPSADVPNDEGGTIDNDNDPESGSNLIFSTDAPGWYASRRSVDPGADTILGIPFDRAIERLIYQHNFAEFVRVDLSGASPPMAGEAASWGSRSSYKVFWHSRIDLIGGAVTPTSNGEEVLARNFGQGNKGNVVAVAGSNPPLAAVPTGAIDETGD